MRLRPDSLAFIVLLSALGGLTPLSIDMGLPALQAIGHSLQIAPAAAALTLSVFLAGFAFGPVALGPMSDRFGRRPVLLFGSLLFAVAGLGCALAPTLPLLLFWRLLEGIGAGAGSTLSLAIIRDLFDGARARTRLSYISTVGSLAPMLAPTLGALVLAWFGWRAIYGFLAAAGLLLVFSIFFGLEESHRNLDRSALQPGRLVANYSRIFRTRLCLGYALVASLNFGCMFSYISSSPLVMMGVLKVAPTSYGFTFAATALGIMAGAFLNGRWSARGVSSATLLKSGLGLSAFSAVSLIVLTHSNWVSVGTILPLLIVNTFCVGLIGPNATQGVMHPVPELAGVAAAVLGSLRMLFGALAGVIVSLLFDNRTAQAMAESMSFFALAALLVYYLVIPSAERVVPVTSPALNEAGLV